MVLFISFFFIIFFLLFAFYSFSLFSSIFPIHIPLLFPHCFSNLFFHFLFFSFYLSFLSPRVPIDPRIKFFISFVTFTYLFYLPGCRLTQVSIFSLLFFLLITFSFSQAVDQSVNLGGFHLVENFLGILFMCDACQQIGKTGRLEIW